MIKMPVNPPNTKIIAAAYRIKRQRVDDADRVSHQESKETTHCEEQRDQKREGDE